MCQASATPVVLLLIVVCKGLDKVAEQCMMCGGQVVSAYHTDRNGPKTVHGPPLLNQIQGCVGCLEITNFFLKKEL